MQSFPCAQEKDLFCHCSAKAFWSRTFALSSMLPRGWIPTSFRSRPAFVLSSKNVSTTSIGIDGHPKIQMVLKLLNTNLIDKGFGQSENPPETPPRLDKTISRTSVEEKKSKTKKWVEAFNPHSKVKTRNLFFPLAPLGGEGWGKGEQKVP